MKKKQIWKFFSQFGFLFNLGFSGLLVLTYLSAYIPPDTFWPTAFLGLLYPYLLLVNLTFVCVYALLKSKKLLLSLLVMAIGYPHFFNFIQPLPNFSTTSGGIKVVTFNVHHFANDLSKKRSDHPKVIEYLQRVNADIVCLQETRLFKTGKLSPEEIRDALPGIKHYQLAHSIAYAGPLTLSRFPIARMGEIRFDRSANMVLFSDIVLPSKDTVRVYNCHFQSYRITPEDYTLTDPDRSGTNEQQLLEARQISRKMALAYSMRARQARSVAAHIRKCPYPVIVCGDFNDTPHSYTYQLLAKQMKDAFAEAGFGISSTYNGFAPMLRIDFILCSQNFSVTSYQRDKIDLSDHFPVTGKLRLLKTD